MHLRAGPHRHQPAGLLLSEPSTQSGHAVGMAAQTLARATHVPGALDPHAHENKGPEQHPHQICVPPAANSL